MPDPLLVCRDLWKIYGSAPEATLKAHSGAPSPEALKESGHIAAVAGVSLEIQSGEILVIMGLSGSGKSTLVRCLSRLIEPTAGGLQFEGNDLLAATPKEMIDIRRRKMGMVFQNFALLPHRTVLRNIAFPLEVQGVPRVERERKARELAELVGLNGREKYYPRELSGGQQQRVGIARSLAVEPDLWFLDEPFSALDPLIRREMQDEFLRLQGMLHKTIVFITHDFDEAIRLADRIAIMYEGRVVQVGSPEEIITQPADDYVSKFTQDVSKTKILTVASIAEEGSADGEPVAASALLGEVAKRLLNASEPVPVVNDSGEPAGRVRRERVLDVLFSGGND